MAAGDWLVQPHGEVGIVHRFSWIPHSDAGAGLVNGYARLLHLDGLRWVENGRPAPTSLEVEFSGDE